MKKYDVITNPNSTKVLVYKQEDGDALDRSLQVATYSNVFDVIRQIHEREAGNDHPKSKTLYRRVFMKYGKSISHWVCEMFPLFCPVCIRSNPCKKVKVGHQPR